MGAISPQVRTRRRAALYLLSAVMLCCPIRSHTAPQEWIEIELYNSAKAKYWSTPLRHTRQITSAYGWRNGQLHAGIDLGLPHGEPIFAAFDGVVKTSAFEQGYGNYLLLEHDSGLQTLYAHLSARVITGARVVAGQMIARGGNTGWSTGAHLHFEVRYRGRVFNPAYIFDFAKAQIKVDKLYLSTQVFAPQNTLTDKW